MFTLDGKLKNSLNALFFCILISGCAQTNPQKKFLMANLYYQKAPEVKALYYQGYNAATDYLKKRKSARGQCIVMDVDETILDNSPYQGWLFDHKQSYTSKTWEAWVAKEVAPSVPGAVEFYRYAKKRGFKVYLITNRKKHLTEFTINNLKKVGIAVSRDEIIGRDKTSSKVERRQDFTKKCQLVLLAGDSLADFHERFEGSPEERKKALDDFKDRWGRDFIVFPNPMYGDWTRKEAKEPLSSFEMP